MTGRPGAPHRAVAPFALLALLLACSQGSGLLPAGSEVGWTDVEKPENYSGSTLYTYMDGGADIFLEYGFANLAVRRYARGPDRLVAELFEMKDERGAAGVYSFTRRAGSERDVTPACRASITDTEIVVARGRYYLVCRNEDPMAKDSAGLKELAARVVDRLKGPMRSES